MILRFEDFELDLSRVVLRRGGTDVRIEPQVFCWQCSMTTLPSVPSLPRLCGWSSRSFDLFDEDERRMSKSLSVFAGQFDLGAAESISRDDALDLLIRLTRRSMLAVRRPARGAGFEVVERAARVSLIEWPDAELAWRALSSVGPAVPALQNADSAIVKQAVLEAIAHCRDDRGAYRFQNDHHFVIACKS